MSGIKQIEKIIAELKENQLRMDARLKELEAGSVGAYSNTPLQDEATDDDLIYILRVHGEEAYRKALRVRNKQRARHNAPYKTTPHPDPLPMRGEGRRAGGGA